MTYTIPTQEPWDLPVGDTRRKVTQGVTLSWYKTLSNFLPADGWTLTYILASASARYTITATDNGDGRFLCTATAATTDDWAAGTYQVLGYVSYGDDVHEVYRGTCEVLVGLQLDGNALGVDTRSHARKVRDALRTLIEGRASEDQLSMSVSMPDGTTQSVGRMTREDLFSALRYYESLVVREENEERVERGLGARNKIRVSLE